MKSIEGTIMYRIEATVSRTFANGNKQTIQVPTFYLNQEMQNIVNENHAGRIAEDMLRSLAGLDTKISLIVSVGLV